MLGQIFTDSLLTGNTIGNYNIYKSNRWNAFDDIGLFKNLTRRNNETNKEFRTRILKASGYNSTKQGVLNYLSDVLDLNRITSYNKKIFYSVYIPLSYGIYKKLIDPDESYIPPIVIVDGDTYSFPLETSDINNSVIEFDGFDESGNPVKYSYSYEKTVIYDSTGTKYITLWKNIDQTYLPIFEFSFTPQSSIIFKYQYLNSDNEIKYIEERNS